MMNDDPIVVEMLARMLHESGREAVEQHKVVNDLGKPFLRWHEISEDAREGRRMMARYLFARLYIVPKWRKDSEETMTLTRVGELVNRLR